MTVDPLLSVGLVLLALFAALSWLARRLPRGALSSDAKRLVLTPEHTVHVIEAGGLRLLVGTGPSSAPQVLARLGEIEHAEAEPLSAAKPATLFDRPALLGRLGAVGGR